MALKRLARRINRMVPEIPLEDDPMTFVRAKRLAKQWDCDVRTIKRLVLSGKLPGFKRGSTLLIRRTDAEAYLESHRVKPLPEGFKAEPKSAPAA